MLLESVKCDFEDHKVLFLQSVFNLTAEKKTNTILSLIKEPFKKLKNQ
jgi:hypothetical protein